MASAASQRPASHYFIRIVKRWGRLHRTAFFLSNVLVVVVALTTAAYPLLIDLTLESLQAGEKMILYIVPPLIIGLTFCKGIALYFQTIVVSRISNRIVTDMRGDLYASLMLQDLGDFDADRAGALQSRVLHDTDQVRASLTALSGKFLRDVVTVICLFGSMIYLDWVLSCAAVLIYMLSVRPVISVGRRTRRLAKDEQERTGLLASFLSEGFLGIRVVKAFNLEKGRINHGRCLFEDLNDILLALDKRAARLSPILEAGGGLVAAVVIVIAGWRILDGLSTVAAFSGFISALLMALRPARTLASFSVTFQQSGAAAERIFDRLGRAPTIVDSPDAQTLSQIKGEIAFKDVSFSYPDGAPVLKDFNLVVSAGERVAIVGPSGAGKTTIANLVLRLFDPDQGTVSIDGIDIRDVTLASLRDSLALVTQEAMLFHGTVRENVAFGREGAGEEEIQASLATAAADFVFSWRDGIDTIVGDQGGRLSGGERQRIAIARAFLRDPAILLLDEPTSALDAKTEHRIQMTLAELARNRTTVTITHRLSTAVDADRILLINDGRIVDQGSHDDLVAHSQEYRRLVELQKLPASEQKAA